MQKKLRETYRLADQLFPNISKSCNQCNTCCKTYGWLLKSEAGKLSEKGYPVVKINKNLHCFDSFVRDKSNKRIYGKIPRCLFYEKGRCSIHNERPLDCRLFPIKVKFKDNKTIIGLSLGCKYVSCLTEKQKDILYRRVIIFLKKAPKQTINDYLNLMKEVNLISKPKRFWMRKIAEIEIRERDNLFVKNIDKLH